MNINEEMSRITGKWEHTSICMSNCALVELDGIDPRSMDTCCDCAFKPIHRPLDWDSPEGLGIAMLWCWEKGLYLVAESYDEFYTQIIEHDSTAIIEANKE